MARVPGRLKGNGGEKLCSEGKKTMHLLSIPCLIMASINFYVGIYYFYFYLKRIEIREHLPFALLCWSVGLYDIFCFGLYNSRVIHDGIFFQRLQLSAVSAISIFLIWFASVFTKQKVNLAVKLLMAWFVIIFLASLIAPAEFTLSEGTPAIKNIRIEAPTGITYHEGEVGIIYQVEIVSAIAVYIYLLCLFVGYYRRKRKKTVFIFIICQCIYFIAVINDSLVSTGFFSFYYLSEYAFFLIIVAMSCMLLEQFVNLHSAYEELNINLEEKVIERTREIQAAQAQMRRLEGVIPICMYCKKIRNDRESWQQLERYICEHSDAKFSHGVCPECFRNLEL
jgi:hypothetical protein